MTSIIKNQIVKHLSKFAKNLTPDQISLDVLKGKSELKNITLNEDVLTEVLELPSWLRIRKAVCNRVGVQIPWMNLKSKPIQLFIDEIQVEIFLTADKPPAKKKGAMSSLGAMDSGSYGFANKVVEGMSIYVNTLEMHFESAAFGGSFMLSRLAVESRTPGWAKPKDLRLSRLSCPSVNKTILYKHVSWQLLRIEASAHNEGEGHQRNVINAPLRLITSNGRIRIALKKNSTDGAVIHARIMMILEDILWVATLPQLQSAIAFYSHIMKLVNASGPPAVEIPLPARTPQSLAPSDKPIPGAVPSTTFAKFDFTQTSYHLQVKKIDLHLCDDAHCPEVYPPGWDIESGAMQVTLYTLLIDVYPKTFAASDRSKWVRYLSPNPAMNFQEQNLRGHLQRLRDMAVDETTKDRLKRCWPQLMSFNVVFRVLDMAVQCVSDMQTKRDSLFNLFTSDVDAKKAFPMEQFVIHAEFAQFFHPLSDTLPAPPPLTHVQLGPFELLFDKRTVRWILYVVTQISNTISSTDTPSMEPLPITDLRLDLLMPKIIMKLPDPTSDSRLPHRLLLQLSTLTLSNKPLDEQSPFQHLDRDVVDYLHSMELPAGKDLLRNDLIQMNLNATVSGIEEGDQLWMHTSPVWVETDHGSKSKGLLLLADVPLRGSVTLRKEQVNVFVEPQTGISALVDHFQLLQILRLSNDITEFVDLLSSDAKFLSKGPTTPAPTVNIIAAVAEARVHLMLTHGPLPSPYEACPAINEAPMDTSSFGESDSPPLANTPLPTPNNGNGNALGDAPRRRVEAVEEFPEFPHGGGGSAVNLEMDLVSNFDDTMSVVTDISDEDAAYMMPDVSVDPFAPFPEEAEEATAMDLPAAAEKEDRHYKSIMAKNVNVLHAKIDDIYAFICIHDNSTLIQGKAQDLSLGQELNKLRSDVYSALQSASNSPTHARKNGDPKVTFNLSSPANTAISNLKVLCRDLNLQLEDEIIAHLSPFVADEQVTDNKLRMQIQIVESELDIRDPKKKKPMRIVLKDICIEQDEDDLPEEK